MDPCGHIYTRPLLFFLLTFLCGRNLDGNSCFSCIWHGVTWNSSCGGRVSHHYCTQLHDKFSFSLWLALLFPLAPPASTSLISEHHWLNPAPSLSPFVRLGWPIFFLRFPKLLLKCRYWLHGLGRTPLFTYQALVMSPLLTRTFLNS